MCALKLKNNVKKEYFYTVYKRWEVVKNTLQPYLFVV